MSIDPTAQAAFRVPRMEVDALYVPGEQAPASRAGVGTVVSVDSSNTCTVLINDENVTGVMWLGVVPPRVGDVVELELRGDLLVVPASNDIDTFMEGMDETVEHIVSAGTPGTPPAQDLQVGGSMRSVDAWSFWGTDTANWSRELSETGQGMRLYQPAPATLLARNLATIPSGEAGIGPNDAGYSWTAAETQSGTYSGTALVEATQEQSYSGSLSFKATWMADPKPSSVGLRVGGHTVAAQHTAQIWVWVPTGSQDVRLVVQGVAASAVTAVKDAWVQLTLTYTATAAEQVIGITTAAGPVTVAGTVYFDALSVVAGAVPLAAYFDGSNVDSTTDHYDWLGTEHLSASEHWSGAALPATLLATNLITNPSFETNLAQWAGVRAAVTRVASATALFGGYVARLVNDGTLNTHYLNTTTPRYPITPGQSVTFSAYARLISGVGAAYRARIFWYDAADVVVGSGGISGPSASLPSDGSWVRLSVTATAPAGAVSCGVVISSPSEANTDTWEVDAVLGQMGGTLSDYFDGSTATTDDAAYRWEGTAHGSASTKWDSPTGVPPGPAGILWSEMSFDVEPGDTVHFEMDLGEIDKDSTAQVYVLYGGAEGASPAPVDPDTVQVAAGGALALTGAISTLSAAITVPAVVTLPVSGVVEPATARLGVRLVGSGASQVLAVAARATLTPVGWPLGSQWMNPAASDAALPTFVDTGVGATSAITLPTGVVNSYIPIPGGAKKVIFTAPPDQGGVIEVVLSLSVNVPVTSNGTFLEFIWGTGVATGFFGSMPRMTAMGTGTNPMVARGLLKVAAGETVEAIPHYRYSAVNPGNAFVYSRCSVDVMFHPGMVLAGSPAAAPPVSYWDGDSWRPGSRPPAVIDVTQDANAGATGKTNTTTTLTRSASTLHAGANLTLTATVTTGAAGSVTFSQMDESTGIWTVLGTVTLASGKATKTFTPAAGAYSYKAAYGGSPTHNPSTSATLAGTKVQKLVTRTVTLPCAWAQGYQGDDTKVTGTGRDTAVFQGKPYASDPLPAPQVGPAPQFGPGDLIGNRKSLLRFDHTSIPAAATITAVSLVCKSGGWAHWYSGSGGTLVLGSFVSQTTTPTTFLASKTDVDRSRHAVAVGGFTLNISAWANGALEGSTFSGIVIGPGPSDSTQFYGYSTAPAKDQFTLKVTYTNWE